MKRSPITRKRRKQRPAGTVCQRDSKCRRKVYDTYDGKRHCARHLADRLVGDFVKRRDGRCVRCGATEPLDWAHVVSRRYAAVRWSVGELVTDPWNNSVALCRPDHYWQTNNPLEGEDFFRSLGIDYDNLRYLALNDPPADPIEVIERMREAA